MDTFRKFLFIFDSRRPRDRSLVKQENIGLIDQKILSCSPPVKEKVAFGNGLPFHVQIEDLHLKCCILGRNSKNNISRKKVWPLSLLICLRMPLTEMGVRSILLALAASGPILLILSYKIPSAQNSGIMLTELA